MKTQQHPPQQNGLRGRLMGSVLLVLVMMMVVSVGAVPVSPSGNHYSRRHHHNNRPHQTSRDRAHQHDPLNSRTYQYDPLNARTHQHDPLSARAHQNDLYDYQADRHRGNNQHDPHTYRRDDRRGTQRNEHRGHLRIQHGGLQGNERRRTPYQRITQTAHQRNNYRNEHQRNEHHRNEHRDRLRMRVEHRRGHLRDERSGYLKEDYSGYQRDAPHHQREREGVTEGTIITPPPGINLTTSTPRPGSALHAVTFMQKFGYVPKSGNDSDMVFTPFFLSESIKRMQKFGGIPETGEVDEATVKLMQTPRCGLPDVEPEEVFVVNEEGGHRRPKRYIVGSEGWRKRRLTYHVANWSPQLKSRANVQKELRKAFDAWSIYSHLQFTEVENQDADIIIYFASFDHADGYPFDGESGILAHAYYPYEFGSYGGDVHFDESETWTIEPEDEYSGLDFFTVAVHEIGHSLGLAHSPVAGSIMFPYYKGYEPNFALDYDDVMALWELYIKRRLEGDDEYFNTTTTTTPTPSLPDTDHQSDEASGGSSGGSGSGGDDGVTRDEGEEEEREKEEEEDSIYEKDRKRREEEEKRREEERKRQAEEEEEERKRREEVQRREEEVRRREEEERRRWEEEEERRRWEYEEETRRREEERRRRGGGEGDEEERRDDKVKEDPPPSLCDGHYDAMAMLRQELFIFKGKYLWRYQERGQVVDGYPTKIHSLFPLLPKYINRVDAVYERKRDSSIVFFVGKYYFVHDGEKLVEGSPRPLTDLGIPEFITEIDAVFYWPKAAKTYIFTRQGYYRFNETSWKMDPGYPKHMNRWNGLPDRIDTAFTWSDGQSYFLSGHNYWKYDNDNIRPQYGYPRPAFSYWAGCPSSSHSFPSSLPYSI